MACQHINAATCSGLFSYAEGIKQYTGDKFQILQNYYSIVFLIFTIVSSNSLLSLVPSTL